jgi:hypothetical protein
LECGAGAILGGADMSYPRALGRDSSTGVAGGSIYPCALPLYSVQTIWLVAVGGVRWKWIFTTGHWMSLRRDSYSLSLSAKKTKFKSSNGIKTTIRRDKIMLEHFDFGASRDYFLIGSRGQFLLAFSINDDGRMTNFDEEKFPRKP